ncbi:hypothetical protein GOBAR_AA04272 [Gossypium barbadense]|uniref:Uncharacterized protein n=1 Tax=Gossypium barbadense TaxID=3634 RepID=A0A2P5YL91_GOSBA|nr:hypothetical protein GOBAR_AA04272 [Gossypium barbadense]
MQLPFKMRKALAKMPNAVKFLKEILTNKRKLDEVSHVELNVEISSKNLYEPCSSNKKEPIYEERRLQIEKLDEWQIQKLRKLNKPKLSQDELNTSPNHLKVGDKVLPDAVDPRITTSEPNEEIPLTVLCIFPYGIVEVIHPKFGTFKRTTVPTSKKKKGVASSSGPTAKIRHLFLEFPLGPQEELFQILQARPLGMADAVRALLTTELWGLFFEIIELTYLKLAMDLCSTFYLQVIMTNFDNPRMVQFCLGGLVRQLSVPEFRIALGLYMEEFIDDNELDTLLHGIHYSPSKCWKDLVLTSASYGPSRFKASALALSL